VRERDVFLLHTRSDGPWGPYTRRFIMFSVITDILNKKTKGPALIELFTATGKQKKFLTTRNVRCVHHEWHGTHRYDIQVLATHASTWVHWCSSLLQWSVPLGQRSHVAILGCTAYCVLRVLLREWWRPIGLMLSFIIFTASVRNILGAPLYNVCA
jgi:hypothetical protein